MYCTPFTDEENEAQRGTDLLKLTRGLSSGSAPSHTTALPPPQMLKPPNVFWFIPEMTMTRCYPREESPSELIGTFVGSRKRGPLLWADPAQLYQLNTRWMSARLTPAPNLPGYPCAVNSLHHCTWQPWTGGCLLASEPYCPYFLLLSPHDATCPSHLLLTPSSTSSTHTRLLRVVGPLKKLFLLPLLTSGFLSAS